MPMAETVKPGKRLPHGGLPVIREALHRLLDRGVEPTVRGVIGELKRWRFVGCSKREAALVVSDWRRQQLVDAEGRIEAAAASVLALGTNLERDAVRRLVAERSRGNVTLRFTVKSRDKGGRRPRKTAVAQTPPPPGQSAE